MFKKPIQGGQRTSQSRDFSDIVHIHLLTITFCIELYGQFHHKRLNLNAKSILHKFLKPWKLFQKCFKCVTSDAKKCLRVKMDEILIHVSSEIVFSFLKNRKRNPVFKNPSLMLY